MQAIPGFPSDEGSCGGVRIGVGAAGQPPCVRSRSTSPLERFTGRMRPVPALLCALAAAALVGVLASPAAANPPLPLPELGTVVGEGLTVEGPLVQNVSLLK
jgi:hypothetical protein